MKKGDGFKQDFLKGWSNYNAFVFKILPNKNLGFHLVTLLLYFFGFLFVKEILTLNRVEYLILYVLMGVSGKLSQMIILIRANAKR